MLSQTGSHGTDPGLLLCLGHIGSTRSEMLGLEGDRQEGGS
jgi:hypothetical protein